MFTVRFLIGALFAACFCLGNYDNALASHNFSAPELKPVSGSYKIAKSTFLPDADGDLGLSGHSISKYDHNYGDNCAGYNLEACPDGGICSSCPFNLTKKKLVSCKSGFEKSGSSCKASSCGAINSSYKDSIPTNQICTKFTEDGKTCYKDCKDVDCSGYPLTNCTTTVANSTGLTICPDCESANANCSPKKCKITACNTGYKLNADETACVEKDDTCPTGYYKTCETGTIGDPVQTEKGTNCYQCKALDDNCPSGYTKQSCINGYSATATTEAGSTCYLCKSRTPVCSGCALNTAVCNGKENTKKIVNEFGSEAFVASACNQFYVGSSSDANFGKGKWYLPSIGEWMDVYGYNVDEITDGIGKSGYNGNNLEAINTALDTLIGMGVEASVLRNECYLSSSEYDKHASWVINIGSGYRTFNSRMGNGVCYARSFLLLENKFSASVPTVGNVIYTDLTFDTADNYNDSKTAAGIVTWVSENGKSVKIINLKDLTFSDYGSAGNFDPNNPYGGSVMTTSHTSSLLDGTETSVVNFVDATLLAAIQGNCEGRPCEICSEEEEWFVQNGYDMSEGTCIYTDEDELNFCIGPQCSETEYPYEYDCVKGCYLAPKHNKWAETRACLENNTAPCPEGDENCSRNNFFCYYLLDCNNYSDEYYSCTEQDSDYYVTSVKIAGDFEKFTCPEYHYCNASNWYNPTCEIAGDFNESLKTLVNAACPNISSGADARLVVFYKDANNADVENLLKRLNILDDAYGSDFGILSLAYTNGTTEIEDKKVCYNPNCETSYQGSTSICLYDQMYYRYVYTYTQPIGDSLCKMNHCDIKLYDEVSDLASAYGVDEETAAIINSVMSNKISETAPFRIYLWRTDNDTFAEDTYQTNCGNTECFDIAKVYLGKSGACSKSADFIRNIQGNGHVTSTCADYLIRYTHKMYYNPDTLSNHSSNSDWNACVTRLTEGKSSCYDPTGDR